MKKVFKTKKLRCPFPTLVHTGRHQDKKLRYPFPTLVRTWRLQEQDASTLFSTLVRTPRVWTILTTTILEQDLFYSAYIWSVFSNIDKTHTPDDEKLLAALSAIAAMDLSSFGWPLLARWSSCQWHSPGWDGRRAFWRVQISFFRVWTILTTIVQRLELLVSSWLLNTL